VFGSATAGDAASNVRVEIKGPQRSSPALRPYTAVLKLGGIGGNGPGRIYQANQKGPQPRSGCNPAKARTPPFGRDAAEATRCAPRAASLLGKRRAFQNRA
jgi:hypothetical protein